MWITTDEHNYVPAFFLGTPLNGETTSFPCQVVNLGKYDSMVAIVSLYTPSAAIIWVDEYASRTPTGAGTLGTTGNYLPVAASYRYSVATATTPVVLSASSDKLSARATLASTGLTLTAATTSVLNYYIEIKSADLHAGYPYVAIAISTSATACTGACVNYVMKPRYSQLDMVTALS